jgi:hypothetical protein
MDRERQRGAWPRSDDIGVTILVVDPSLVGRSVGDRPDAAGWLSTYLTERPRSRK